MSATLKIIQIGDSVGVVLPPELLAHLGAQLGDQLSVARTSRGLALAMPLAEYGPANEEGFEHQMAIAREIMERDRAILAALAKS